MKQAYVVKENYIGCMLPVRNYTLTYLHTKDVVKKLLKAHNLFLITFMVAQSTTVGAAISNLSISRMEFAEHIYSENYKPK